MHDGSQRPTPPTSDPTGDPRDTPTAPADGPLSGQAPDAVSTSGRAPAPPGHTGSLWRLPAVRFLALYTLFGFTGFFATLSALPAWMAGRGTAESVAGLVTTTLLVATVSTQTLVPRLLETWGMTTVLTVGAIALGAPSLLLLVDGGLAWVLVICAVRGIGFGIVTVLGSTLTARIVPQERRGEAIGIYGLAIALPNLVVVAGGVALVTAGHFPVVAILGAAPLLGVLTVTRLARAAGPDPEAPAPESAGRPDPASDAPASSNDPGSPHAPAPAATGSAAAPGTPATLARHSRRVARIAALGPAAVLMVVTLASGGFMTYLPIERPDGALATIGLLLWGATGAFARWRVGLLADRSGLRLLLPSASVLSIVGLLIVVAGLLLNGSASWIVTLAGSAVLGLGYGATQNLTLVAAFARARQRETATVSSVWNVGFDTGTAIGSGLVGVLTLVMAIPGALALTTVLIAVSMPLAVRSARPPE